MFFLSSNQAVLHRIVMNPFRGSAFRLDDFILVADCLAVTFFFVTACENFLGRLLRVRNDFFDWN